VRTGLVILGVVIAVLGAGLFISLFFLFQGPSTTSQIRPEDPNLSPNSNQSWVLPGPAAVTGTVSLSWTTSAGADVALWPAITCTAPGGFCPTGVAVLNWTLATAGTGTVNSASGATFILIVTNPGHASLRFAAVVSVTSSPGTTITPWVWVLIAAGGVALLAIGGIALFLGLYLPGGVYRDPDAEMVVVRHPSLPPEEFEADPGEDAR
jgi:hypothetical protein